MKILIAGYGYVGTALGQKLASSGTEVWGLRRNTRALNPAALEGVKLLEADLLSPDSLLDLPAVDAIVFCQAPSRETDDYMKTYAQATRNLLAAYEARLPQKIVFISSTSVYPTQDGSWVDEKTDPASGVYSSAQARLSAKALLLAERAVLSSGVPSVVFRLTGIYGPGRHRLRALKEGKMKPSFSEIYTNRIHRDDIVSGVALLLEKGAPGEIYIGVDDQPSTQKEFYSWVCEKIKIPAKAEGAGEARTHVSNRRFSNAKIKALGLHLKYGTFREGYADLLCEAGNP